MAEKKSGWEAWRAKNEKNSSSKPKSNSIIDSIEKNVKKKVKKSKSAKTLKKIHPAYVFIVLVFFFIGIAGGAFFAQNAVKSDTFELIGNKVIIYYVGDNGVYDDSGVICISMGENISNDVEITTDLTRGVSGYTINTETEGEYTITYTMKNGRYKDKSLVRVIKVITMSEIDDEPTQESGGDE